MDGNRNTGFRRAVWNQGDYPETTNDIVSGSQPREMQQIFRNNYSMTTYSGHSLLGEYEVNKTNSYQGANSQSKNSSNATTVNQHESRRGNNGHRRGFRRNNFGSSRQDLRNNGANRITKQTSAQVNDRAHHPRNQNFLPNHSKQNVCNDEYSSREVEPICDSRTRRETKPMSFTRVRDLLSKDPHEIVLTIVNKESGFTLLLRGNMGRDLTAYVWLVLHKAISATLSRCVSIMINEVTSIDKFVDRISNYLITFQKFSSEEHHLNSLVSITEFLYKFQMTLPSNASDIILIIHPQLEKVCQRYLVQHNEYSSVLNKLKDLENQNTDFLKAYKQPEIKKISQKERLQLLDPPENYRTLPTLPGIEDIRCSSAFIRPNLVDGRYTDSEHYLDIQYRLLREDYVKPLRDGIAEYLKLKKSGKSVKHCRDVRVYENVKIVDKQFVNGGLVHIAYFEDPSFSRIKWDYSKRFLSGSLLCFSSDNFENLLFATVARRNSNELQRGLLLLRFEKLSDEVLNISPQQIFSVIETTAYFEAYRHNLNALIQLDDTNLPMKRYIVEVQKDVLRPQYLQRTTTYDMRPLLIPLNNEHIKHEKDAKGKICTNYEFPINISSRATSINILDEKCWPTCDELKLDPSQFSALKAAVTEEFSIIQGPPGTGKTYIGLRIAQLLLHNINKWRSEESNSPILVVCYTNHALDQFLEGLLMFTQNIVRVGGRGQNEALAKFQLSNLKRIIGSKREVPYYIFSSLKQKQSDLHALKMDIDKIKKIVYDSFNIVLPENQLRSFISDYQYSSLKRCDLHNDGCLIYDWLGIRMRASKLEDGFIVDDSYSDDEDDNEDYEFTVDNIYKQTVLNIPAPQGRKDHLNNEIKKLRNGVLFKEALAKQISNIIENCEPFEVVQALNIKNIWNLNAIERWKLYKCWLGQYIKRKQHEYLIAVKQQQSKLESRSDRYEIVCLNQHIQLLKSFLKNSILMILDENALKDSMFPGHYASLVNGPVCSVENNFIFNWLNFFLKDINELKNRVEMIESLSDIAIELKNAKLLSPSEALPVNDDQIDSEGEADVEYIEAQREIDSDEFADASFDFFAPVPKQNVVPEVDSGWVMQGGKKSRKRYIRRNLQNNDKMSEQEANEVRDVWDLPIPQRWLLYKYWRERYIENKNQEAFVLQQNLREEYEAYCELRTEEDLYVCRQAHVVGMTTTGAAKYRHIVQNLNPRIVIVEEAAEILESHLVTSLAPGTQHVILIGDHQQLRPSPTVHLLSVKFDLDVSLFERMVKNGLDCHQLGIQHRMRPDIAALLVPHIYERLENHESVTKYENIRGVKQNVYFITHQYSELQENDTKSKVNQHEAKFLLNLCRYFILQGYDPSQITILTTYSGQLFAMKRIVKSIKILQSVKITVVDNYQGEENDIILVSFVRSNEDGEIGFLKISNRVCVALSRAKKGLFCIGNFQLLASKSDLWNNIITVLQHNNAIGASLQLVCQNHPTTSNTVASNEDFNSVPEGGCTRDCEYRLPCGHVCPKVCHPYDQEHVKINCLKPCNKTCEIGHQCKRKCSEKCGPCLTRIPKKLMSCGHEISVACHRKNEETKCDKKCELFLQCGHKCAKICGEECSLKCEQECIIRSSVCGHDVKIKCFDSKNPAVLVDNCSEPCRVQLSCEHLCRGTCSKCHQGRLHIACYQPCKRILVCGHECKSPCSKSCPPCKRACENRCVHSKCPKSCGEPCETCTEPCEWSCKHMKCYKLCGEECNRNPCNQPCPKSLSPCGHPCIGLCGEPCPSQCRVCNEDEVKEIFFGMEDEADARFIYLEDCNHIFEVDGISRWMVPETKEVQMKSCPKCRVVIRRNLRFGNIIKSCLHNIEKVKIVTYGDKRKNLKSIETLISRLNKADNNLKSICKPLLNVLKSGKSKSIQEITIMENIYHIAKTFVKATEYNNIAFIRGENIDIAFHDSLQKLKFYLQKTSNWLILFLQDEYLTASDQQLQELTWEIHRLQLAGKLLQYVGERTNIKAEAEPMWYNLLACLMTYVPFREKNEQTFVTQFQQFVERNGDAVINISDMEKQSILKAMNLTRGHWYQCPNGHVYCITECGGATQESTCNECGAKIGGTHHTLLSNNRVATAMDGARHSAWSDAMNLNNYQF